MSKFPAEIRISVVRYAPAFLALMGSTAGLSCLPGQLPERHASVVEAYLPTPFIDENMPYGEPDRALGPPDGRTVALGVGSSITLRFFRSIPDARGPDLRVIEVGPDGSTARIAVSEDGENFLEFALPAGSGKATLYDLSDVGLTQASTVRIRGLDNLGPDPGFDLDAVEALH